MYGSEGRPPIYKGHGSPSKGHATKPKSFGESGRSNTSAGFQKTSFSYNAKPHDEQKSSSATSSSAIFDRFAEERVQGLCFFYKKPGHIKFKCPKRRAGQEQDDVPVQLVSTVSSPVTQGHVDSSMAHKPHEVDPRFAGQCSLVTLIRPDHSGRYCPSVTRHWCFAATCVSANCFKLRL